MSTEQELERVVQQLEDIVSTAASDTNVSDYDLRRVLSFIAKVVHVVDQAFADVYSLLVEFKYLSLDDKESGRLDQLRKELDLIQARSRYRDAEEICSRLHHLRSHYEDQLQGVVTSIGDPNKWREVFWIVEEREGRIIRMVHESVRELSQLVEEVSKTRIDQIRKRAAERAEAIRASLQELRELSNSIMGLSGQPGFLELTADRAALSRQARIFINRGGIRMSQRRINVSGGQVGVIGDNAHAHDMTFQQVWNQSASQIDLAVLANELAALRQALKDAAQSAEHDAAVGEVAAAETAAKKGDGPSVLERLKSAGEWVLDVAVQKSLAMAVTALKTALEV